MKINNKVRISNGFKVIDCSIIKLVKGFDKDIFKGFKKDIVKVIDKDIAKLIDKESARVKNNDTVKIISNDNANVIDNNTGNSRSLQSCPFDLQKVPIRPIKFIYEILKKAYALKLI